MKWILTQKSQVEWQCSVEFISHLDDEIALKNYCARFAVGRRTACKQHAERAKMETHAHMQRQKKKFHSKSQHRFHIIMSPCLRVFVSSFILYKCVGLWPTVCFCICESAVSAVWRILLAENMHNILITLEDAYPNVCVFAMGDDVVRVKSIAFPIAVNLHAIFTIHTQYTHRLLYLGWNTY